MNIVKVLIMLLLLMVAIGIVEASYTPGIHTGYTMQWNNTISSWSFHDTEPINDSNYIGNYMEVSIT